MYRSLLDDHVEQAGETFGAAGRRRRSADPGCAPCWKGTTPAAEEAADPSLPVGCTVT